MLTLALDTTTAAGSVALLEGRRVFEVAPIDSLAPVATRLPGDLMALLARHRVELTRVELFAVATGPGSFTGLRIGIATMQGLALANHRPLIGVSAFEALASAADVRRVAPWIDAWRGEVYGTVYEDGREIVEPAVGPPEEILRGGPPAPMFIGDGAVRYREMLGARVIEPTPLLAGQVARLAHARADRGEAPPPHAIRPLYVRRPDAELARGRRTVP